jgi:hypothetical protein
MWENTPIKAIKPNIICSVCFHKNAVVSLKS